MPARDADPLTEGYEQASMAKSVPGYLAKPSGTLSTPGTLPSEKAALNSVDPADILVSSSVDWKGYAERTSSTGQASPAVGIIGVAPQKRTAWLPTDRVERETKTKPDGTTIVVERNLELGASRIVP